MLRLRSRLVGLFALRRRIAAEPGLWVLLAVAALNATLLVYLAARVGYVSERHTVLLTMIGCLFAAASLESIASGLGRIPKIGTFWAGPFGPPALLVILVGLALPATLKPLHPNREGFKHAGQWLASRIENDDCLIDPFSWTEWYAGRSLYFVPADVSDRPKVTYAVVDDRMRGDEHDRLPRLDAAKNVLADGRRRLVYCWPEGSTEETAKVKIYRLDRD